MGKSIFNRIFIYMSVLIIVIMGLILVSVSLYLDDFYYRTQETNIASKVNSIERSYSDVKSDNVQEIIDYYAENLGMSIQIVSVTGKVIINSSNYTSEGKLSNMMEMRHGRFSRMNMKDMMGDHDYLVYSEELEDGNIILVRTAYQSFENAISALRQFIRFLLVPIFVIAFIVIYFLSRSISHPLMELNRVAKKMKELDFKAKYKVISEDETGQLGNTLNELTIKLEDTIDKLKDELKKEKDMEKIRKEFVARVSHELQTPLSVIEGYIEAIEDKVYEKEEDVNRALGIISRESEKMSKMTQDLLDLSLMESGSYKLTTDRFNYIELIKDVYQRFLDRKKQACVTFILEIPNEDEFMVMGDVFRIEQVLNNLINNAFNYVSDCGKIVMRVTPDPDGWIKTEVSNTGSGISQEDLPFLWESFFKSHKEKGKKGAGLGLSIAKNIINLHNGKYDVKNIKDGVVFSFDLKYDKSEKGQ